jgi:hypothetical protein
MDRELLACIFVPTYGKQRRDGGGAHGHTGTGYAVGNSLVLTARHVVVRPEERDKRYRIQILWEVDRKSGWIELDCDPKAIAWAGTGDMDAALLRCRYPSDLRSFADVSNDQPGEGVGWVSAGYPDAGLRDNRRAASSFAGTTFKKSPGNSYFEVDASRAAPDTQSAWRGASGMPIIPMGKTSILGIAIEAPEHFAAKKLHAVPAFLLRQAPGFLDALEESPRIQRLAPALSAVERCLDPSPAAREALARTSGCSQDTADGSRIAVTSASELARHVLKLPLSGVIEAFGKALGIVKDGDSKPAKDAVQRLLQAVQWVVPTLFDAQVAARLHAETLDPNVVISPLEHAFPPLGEIIMASYDGRQTEFRPRKGATDYPHGKYFLALPPEEGISAATEKQGRDIREALVKAACPGNANLLLERMHRYMIEAWLQPTERHENDPRRNLANARRQLEAISKLYKRTYYLIWKIPDDKQARDDIETSLRSLKADFPTLVILGFAADKDKYDEEMDVFRDFFLMLPERSRTS